MKTLGSQFKELRIRNCMSQKELSEKTGIHVNTIMGFENGKHSPSTDKALRLLSAMGYELTLSRKKARA